MILDDGQGRTVFNTKYIEYLTPTEDKIYGEPPFYCTTNQTMCGHFNNTELGLFYNCLDVKMNPKDNTLGFDNLLLSSLNVFQIATYENWADIMYLIRDIKKTRAYDILFIISIFLGSMVVLNLMVAVLASELEAAFEKEDQREQEL